MEAEVKHNEHRRRVGLGEDWDRNKDKVGPGKVDDELQLEEDVVSECGKYGTVTRVIIFEITQPNFPTHEAVRIFVLFSRPEETTKALVAQLDGRFFGGRTVRATFYDELKFSMNELAPVPAVRKTFGIYLFTVLQCIDDVSYFNQNMFP
ncbi:hypothetical protein HID58_075164 [Brassica napus]|uniref:RNA recognition motif domain-containing protein n=1 Tax=Brassica napus TaxID=3708 RepID=A0ABQ7YIW9_BRANA|nr:hypothetical protein HID58_075164 [Brassica napus]